MRSRLITVGLCLSTGFLLVTNPVVVQAAQTITGTDIKDGSVTTRDLRDGSLLARDFKQGQLPSGPQGEPGQDAASVVEIRRMKGFVENLTQTSHPSDPDPGQPGVHFFGPTRTVTVTTGQIVTASARVDIFTRVMAEPESGLDVEICWQQESADHPYYPDSSGGPAPTEVGRHTTVTPVIAWYMQTGTYQIGVCGVSTNFDDRFDIGWTGYIQVSNTRANGNAL